MSEEDYDKLKFIGGGTYGQVYKARRKDNKDQVCALKYISKNVSRKDIRDAKNEIYIMERLRHPNIVQLLGNFETPKHIVLVCEYAVKELFRAMRNEWKGKFTEEKARKISCQICSALFYLHSQKVLHRDMKPQNVLVTKDETIKLCDFGFSRFMGDTYYARTIQGTLLYMAPELFQEKSHVHYTEKVDLWALGCIIYELCVGKPPFISKSLKELCSMHENLSLPKDMTDILKDLLTKLLATDPHRRIPWPYILKHKWFKGDIEVSKFDVSRESPYTRPEIASEKRKEHRTKIRMIQQHRKRLPHTRDARYGEKRKGDRNAGVEKSDGKKETDGLEMEPLPLTMSDADIEKYKKDVVDVDVDAGRDVVDSGGEKNIEADRDMIDADAYWAGVGLHVGDHAPEGEDGVDGEKDEDVVDTVVVIIYEDDESDEDNNPSKDE